MKTPDFKKAMIATGGRWVPVFYGEDMPRNVACGMSIYRGVLVQWIDEFDTRILDALDRFPAHILERLLLTAYAKGSIWLGWSGPVPAGYRPNYDMVEPGDGDAWSIAASYSIDMPTGVDKR